MAVPPRSISSQTRFRVVSLALLWYAPQPLGDLRPYNRR